MTGEFMVPANGADLCAETFGEPSDPPLLLISGGASSMDWWEDEFCRRLAAGGRHVIRYDHRDTGRSTAYPEGAPGYTIRDLAWDALGLLDALGERQAHVVGLSMGGGLAQLIAVNHPERLHTLTLMSTSAGSSPDEPEEDVPADADVPEEDEPAEQDEAGERFDWSDRKAAVDRMVAEVQSYGGPFTADEDQLRRLAERVFDRTTDMAATQTNHWAADFPPSHRHLLGAITAPTLVMHGTLDRLIPMADAEALAREIPGARLIRLEGVGHEFPPQALWRQVIDEILKHTA